MDDRPVWARRITTEREARGWNKPQFIEALRAHTPKALPGKESLLRRVHSWESGATCPDDFYKPLIAKTFGTVTAAIWPVPGSRDADAELIAGAGMDTLEVLTRLRASSVDAATLDGLRITVDRLCSEYPHLPAQQLLLEGPVLAAADHLDAGPAAHPRPAPGAAVAGRLAGRAGRLRRARLDQPRRRRGHPAGGVEPGRGVRQYRGNGLGTGDAGLVRSHPRRLPRRPGRGRHRPRRRPERRSSRAAPRPESQSLGPDRRPAPGRSRPRPGPVAAGADALPDNLDNHFAVDPAKWDFYSMDCYRLLGAGHEAGSTENKLAESYATEVIRLGTDATGIERSPMRNAEARVTLGVVAARQGELERALDYGHRALSGDRLSVPSLLMVSSELGSVIQERYGSDADAADYLDQLRHLRDTAV